MTKRNVEYFEHLDVTYQRMAGDGILLVSAAPHNRPNAMTIGWGTVGIVWGRPMFLVLVRPSRYTYGCLEKTPEFTVNVQTPEMAEVARVCGTASGRDLDKFAELGLTAVPSVNVTPPLIDECAIHYECRIVHRNDIIPDELARQIVSGSYPQGDFHRVYFGEILRTCVDDAKLKH
jgi:flavin reductase (DIM6/NTAB) family NADH-FMN oxidoreductase RutF